MSTILQRDSASLHTVATGELKVSPMKLPRQTLPRLTYDGNSAYIYLATPYPGISATQVALDPDEDEPGTLQNLVLDFDSDGKLVGIEVLSADTVLRQELLRQ